MKMNLLKDPPRMLLSIIKMRITHRGARWNDENPSDSDPGVHIEICPEVQGMISNIPTDEPIKASTKS